MALNMSVDVAAGAKIPEPIFVHSGRSGRQVYLLHVRVRWTKRYIPREASMLHSQSQIDNGSCARLLTISPTWGTRAQGGPQGFEAARAPEADGKPPWPLRVPRTATTFLRAVDRKGRLNMSMRYQLNPTSKFNSECQGLEAPSRLLSTLHLATSSAS